MKMRSNIQKRKYFDSSRKFKYIRRIGIIRTSMGSIIGPMYINERMQVICFFSYLTMSVDRIKNKYEKLNQIDLNNEEL
jgi:hypothetical protein